MELKDTTLTHNGCVAIFEAFIQGTMDNMYGEAVTEFVRGNKLGNPDHSTGENPARTPFKRSKFMANDFKPDSNDKDLLDTKRWILVKDYFQTTGTRLLDLEGCVGRPPEDMSCSSL